MRKPFHARSCALSHMLYHSQDSCGLSSFQKHIHIWCPLKLFKNLESKKIVSMCQQLNICTIRQIQNHENYWYYLVFMQPQYIHNQSLCAPIIEQKMWYLCSNTSFLTIFDRTSSRQGLSTPVTCRKLAYSGSSSTSISSRCTYCKRERNEKCNSFL